jgi:hypothetical protein
MVVVRIRVRAIIWFRVTVKFRFRVEFRIESLALKLELKLMLGFTLHAIYIGVPI